MSAIESEPNAPAQANQAEVQASSAPVGEPEPNSSSLQALYPEGAIEIPEATRDAQMLLDEKDLDNMLRQERMLDLAYQLKLEQWAAWRAKQGDPEGGPQGGKGRAVPDSAPDGRRGRIGGGPLGIGPDPQDDLRRKGGLSL
jgi:hypothetical protein